MPTIFQDVLWHFMLTEALRDMHKESHFGEKWREEEVEDWHCWVSSTFQVRS